MTAADAGPEVAVGSLTTELAEILRREVPAALLPRAARHVLDWIGCAVIGATTEPGRIVAATASRFGAGPCHAIGVGALDATGAAFVNGAYGNALEMDDIHRTAILHPGPVVIPAALAAAEQHGAAPKAFLEAVVRGYEAAIRVGRSVGPGHYRLWHKTASCGVFGSAAAVASILGLDAERSVWALGNAGTQAAGPWQCRLEGAMSKQLHTARAAEAGLVAAELAAAGFTGPHQILEGALGFYAAMCPDPSPAELTADADGPWLISETSFKPWPACRHAHATIDAALLLRERVSLADIRQIVVGTYADAIEFCDNPAPGSTLEAKFSLQHCAAVVLRDGAPDLGSFEAAAYDDPALTAFRDRIVVEAAEPYRAAYPRHYGAGLTARLDDGHEVSVAVADAYGDPENPLPEAGLVAKAEMLMAAAGLPAPRIEAVVAAAIALPDADSLSELTELLPN
ncbi:MAG: MmgE/PrpD family protein [Alphaproteobacteria bacterium]|jgi:2-methylcitrate dehydratase PrpD|nr:MmgE/PrpD family protein [Alphaproteobacteria bacterium]